MINIFNKKLNLSNPKADKKCLHIKPFKKLFKIKNIIGFGRDSGGQVFIEYTVLIVCIIMALIAMQAYLKRGIQGKLRDSADQIGSQYEPGNTESDFTITSKSSISTVSTLTIDKDKDTTNAETIVTTNYDEQTRKGSETVGAF